MSNQTIDRMAAVQMLQEADRILFFLHVSPDGDSIGSTLAMVHALGRAGKTAVAVGVDPVPRIYRFVPGWDTLFVPWDQVEGDWDLACFLDCGDLHRVGAALPLVSRAKRNLNIDHHATNSVYGEYNYLDFSAAAVGELAYRILVDMGLPIDETIATCLYTSIVADTGGFKYDATGPETHRIAAELLERGVKPYEVASAIWENESVPRIAMLARALSTLQVDESGTVAWIHVTQAMMAESGAAEDDVEGLVNYARAIAGVEVGLMFKETPDGNVRVGLRSRRRIDVGVVAKQFGGGGHARAAGCTLSGSIAEAMDCILSAVKAVS